jgi:hypothetical protein
LFIDYIGRQEMSEGEKEPRSNRRYVAGGVSVTAGLFIGLGVGWAMGYLVQGLLIGMGAGFLLFAIIMLTVRE